MWCNQMARYSSPCPDTRRPAGSTSGTMAVSETLLLLKWEEPSSCMVIYSMVLPTNSTSWCLLMCTGPGE